ncbi:MAG: hypothetical protein K2I60_02490, partial [Oscillospiraceae bacterium]|nr:hypothetical protein [Oscillospiraceae bacterium]
MGFDIVRKIFSIFISFVICFNIVLLTFLIVLSNTLFNNSFAKGTIKSSDYALKIKDEMQQEFTSLGSASGFSPELFKTAIDNSKIERDIISSFKNLYEGKGKYESKVFEFKLYNKLLKDSKSRGYVITNEIKSNIKYLANVCNDVYNGAISIPFYEQIAYLLKNGYKFCRSLILLTTVLMVMMLIILLIINIKDKHMFIRYCIYSISSCCLLLIIPLFLICASKIIDRMAVLDIALKSFIVTFLYGILTELFIA